MWKRFVTVYLLLTGFLSLLDQANDKPVSHYNIAGVIIHDLSLIFLMPIEIAAGLAALIAVIWGLYHLYAEWERQKEEREKAHLRAVENQKQDEENERRARAREEQALLAKIEREKQQAIAQQETQKRIEAEKLRRKQRSIDDANKDALGDF